jgi:tetratricopeptide (TPR) repeat protein
VLSSASSSWAQAERQVLTNSPAAAAPATVPSAPDEAAEAIARARALRRQLNRVGIAPLAPAGDPNASGDLMDYVRQIETLQLPQPRVQTPAGNPAPVANASVALPKSAVTATPAAPRTEPNQPSHLYDEKLTSLLNDPSGVVDALAVGEALYKARDYGHAAAFYRVALERMKDRENADPRQVAWATYQIANCLRLEDPAGAAAFYEQLMTQYPNSPWTPAASVQRQIIAWCDANRPNELLEKHARDPNSL